MYSERVAKESGIFWNEKFWTRRASNKDQDNQVAHKKD